MNLVIEVCTEETFLTKTTLIVLSREGIKIADRFTLPWYFLMAGVHYLCFYTKSLLIFMGDAFAGDYIQKRCTKGITLRTRSHMCITVTW